MHCIIVSAAYPLRGGIAHYSALLARTLREHHRVEIVTFKRQYPSLLFPGASQEESTPPLDESPAPQLIDSINPFNWLRVGNELRRRSPQLVIFNYWMPFFGPCFGTIASRVKRASSTRVLFLCHNVLPHESRPFDRAFTRYALSKGDFFIVQSDAVRRDLLTIIPGATYRTVPHPVYSLFGGGLPKEEARRRLGVSARRVVLFFGYVRRYKGLDVLLRAVARARREVDLDLLVVGEFYDDESRYRRLVTELDLTANVRIVSAYVPNDQVALYFSAADVVVLPYLSATQSGIAQIAYNFDTPVIATQVGGLAEVVHDGQNGYVVPPGDPEALARALIRFYSEGRSEEFAEVIGRDKQAILLGASSGSDRRAGRSRNRYGRRTPMTAAAALVIFSGTTHPAWRGRSDLLASSRREKTDQK